MSLCVFLWFQVFSGWNWGTWAKIWFRGWKRTADAVGFWPPCTRSGFSGATEAQLARSQRRWKVDILGFPAMYNSPYFTRDLMAQTGSKSAQNCPAFNAGTGTRMGVKRLNWHKSWCLTPRKVSTHESFNAQPKHTPSGPGSWFLRHLLIFVNPKLLVLYK